MDKRQEPLDTESMKTEASQDLSDLRESLGDTTFELASLKFALDEAAIVAITDIKGTITYVNKKFCEISKYSEEELIGGNHRIINSGYHPVEFFRQMYRTIGKGEVWHDEIRNRAKDGSIYWVDTTIVPLRNREGKLTKYLAIRFDITRLKTIEEQLRRTLQELERSNRELEQFAYVASHDLQEPLRMVSSYAQLLNKRYKESLDEKAEDFLKYITEGTHRMQQLIKDLLTFSRVSSRSKPFERVDCNAIVDGVLTDLRLRIEETGAEILTGHLPEITGDAGLMRQLFQNLISNAIKFHGSERPVVSIGAEEKDSVWEFCVKDNGIGIEKQYYERIFLIFQRLHEREKYPGTGIGLAVCKRIVEHHGGQIRVESTPGNGSAFCFTIPKTAKQENT